MTNNHSAMANTQPTRIKTISDYHRAMGLPKPAHPLISVIHLDSAVYAPVVESASLVFDFYSVSLKRNFGAKIKYGQQEYDFDEGVMFFISPNQVFGFKFKEGATVSHSGWLLLIHPDFLWNTPLAGMGKKYEFFSYAVHEALLVSDREEGIITGLMQSIEQEYQANIDQFSQGIIIAQIETLLNYSERFYQRQFITRKTANHKILAQVETILSDYFTSDDLVGKGLPTVQFVAEQVNVSPNYLSGVLKSLTGQTTQQHIHDKLIEKAKEKLSTTNLSISEIAFTLGFEHSQSFSKLFRTKTSLSPVAFRQSFN